MHARSLRTVIGATSVLMSWALSVGVPVAYTAVRYLDEIRALGLIAEFNAAELATTKQAGDNRTQLDDRPFAHALALLKPDDQAITRRLIDRKDVLIVERTAAPPWPTIARAAPVTVGGVEIGTLQVETSIRPLLGEAGALALICALLGLGAHFGIRVVSLRLVDKVLEEQKGQNLRFDTAINNMTQGLCFFDGNRRLIVCNDRYAEMYGLLPDLVRPGTTLSEIVDYRFKVGSVPAMTPAEYLVWRNSIAIAQSPSDTVIELRNGRTFTIHHQPMPDGGWVATHEDITDRRRTEAQIERMARHDALTGLPNRLLFREHLDEVVRSSRAGESLAVLCIDLDRFKAVNDTLGHPVGDELLRAVAQRLSSCVRQTDMVARLGGDEFAIIQTGAAQPASANALAERLVRMIAKPFDIAGYQVLVGTSVGAALSPNDGLDPDDLLKKADLALYNAKSEGRGMFSFFQAEMGDRAQGRRALEMDLRHAAENGELELFYQPIVGVGAYNVVAFEALLRWRHPKRGLVMPDCFIPVAEDSGMIEQLGEWVLHKACAQAMQWPPEVSVAVNLSPVQFKSGNLVRVVTSALEASGLSPSRIELEITESVLLGENSTNMAILHQLRALGVRVCLDDFGVGYSSLSYLRSFPFKKIKIDRSFVRDMLENKEAASIIRAIAALGRSLGMATTAEGVENEEQLEKLEELGCDEVQGYYLSRPQPASEVEATLKKLHRQLNTI
jgi:diguanylate cyclase (GGDEF)-like protein